MYLLGQHFFEARTEDERHHAHETILEYVQKAPEDIQCEIDKREFDEMIATKNPLLDQIVFHTVSSSVRVGWGLTSCAMLIHACLRVALSPHTFGEQDVDDNGLIVR